jgi:hypothetical protein
MHLAVFYGDDILHFPPNIVQNFSTRTKAISGQYICQFSLKHLNVSGSKVEEIGEIVEDVPTSPQVYPPSTDKKPTVVDDDISGQLCFWIFPYLHCMKPKGTFTYLQKERTALDPKASSTFQLVGGS